jgi:putative transposase
LENDFCISALKRAMARWGQPEIFNSDQGSQFSSYDFQKVLVDQKIQISMDGRGRATDNIAIERFWGTLKRAEVYLNEYLSPIDAYRGISRYINKYNSQRPHTANGDLTPDQAYGRLMAQKLEA